MVYRIYVEKRSGLTVEADALKNDISSFLGIKSVTGVRFLNRYDAENITPERKGSGSSQGQLCHAPAGDHGRLRRYEGRRCRRRHA